MQHSYAGWGSGLLGVLIFSGSLPATRAAVAGFDPLFLTSMRAVLAACLALLLLLMLRQVRPDRRDLASLSIISLGVVIGFPLLSAMALQHITAAHSLVFIGVLPVSTALFGVLRGAERPAPLFWVFSLLGSFAVIGFALFSTAQSSEPSLIGDGLMILAIILCGLGYAEGGILSRRLGGWQVISWALVLSLPLMAALALFSWPQSELAEVPASAWVGLAYVSVFSMLVGFVFWYHGLARGGTTGVGQLQLLQPFFGLLLAALILSEPVAPVMVAATLFVVGCVAGAKRFV